MRWRFYTVFPCVALPLLLLFTLGAAHGQATGRISGTVLDSTAKPLAGVSLTLSGDPGSSAAAHTITNTRGEYVFRGLAFGRYRMSADQPESSLLPAAALLLSSASPELRLTVTLKNKPAQLVTTAANPGLNLQAAGIRGYIDPGGYSAPASEAAASDLVRGIADIKRADDILEGTDTLSCAFQAALLKTLVNNPEDLQANRRLGQIYLSQHQPTQALPYLRRTWESDRNPQITLSLAEALLQSGQFKAARDLLLQNAPIQKTAETHRMLARANEGLGNFREASAEYQAATALQPAEQNLFGAGYELILAGSPEAGARIFQAGLTQFPNSTLMLMGLGTADFLENRSAEATRTFLRAANQDSADPRPYPFLSASFGISGVEADAVKASFERFYRLAPENPEAPYFYAMSLFHQGLGSSAVDSMQVEALLLRSVQLDPRFTKAHIQLGAMYFAEQKYPQAITELGTALHQNPELWNVHYKLAAAYKRTGQTEKADQEMRLFMAHRDKKGTDSQAAEVHISDFLSVLNQPRNVLNQRPGCGDSP